MQNWIRFGVVRQEGNAKGAGMFLEHSSRYSLSFRRRLIPVPVKIWVFPDPARPPRPQNTRRAPARLNGATASSRGTGSGRWALAIPRLRYCGSWFRECSSVHSSPFVSITSSNHTRTHEQNHYVGRSVSPVGLYESHGFQWYIGGVGPRGRYLRAFL